MAKKVDKKVKLMAIGGQATPAPPLGPILGQAGVNIQEFTTRFNEMTKENMGEKIPAVLTIYEDRSFDIVVKQPAASGLILKAVGIKKGSGKNVSKKAGKLTKAQVKEIAERKMPDLNAKDIEGAMAIIEGSARSMGIEVA